MRRGHPGFTLLEMMIVCSLVAVLLTWAIPAWNGYLLRGHRSGAIELLLAVAACQERVYATDYSYNTERCLLGDNSGKYVVGIEPANTAVSSVYVVTADPQAGQVDDPCGSLSLDQSGVRGISGPADRLRKCWEGR